MRAAAALLAGLTALTLAGGFLAGELLLDPASFGLVGVELGPAWVRAVLVAAGALPWAAGAVLLVLRQAWVGTAIVVTSAVLSAPLATGTAVTLREAVGNAPTGWWVVAVLAAGAWLAGSVAGVLAWLSRPRGDWRRGAPGPGGLYTTAAVLAWLPTVFLTSAVAPPGMPRHFLELPTVDGLDLVAVTLVTGGLTAAVVLWVAPRRRRDVAGAMVLTFAVPLLLGQVDVVRAIASEPHVIPTPPGVLGAVGLVTLLVLGSRWVADPPRERGEVSAAATGRGPAPAEGAEAPEPDR
jgi:hypothetical protein